MKIGPKKRSDFDPFSKFNFYRFWTRFRFQHSLKNRRFFTSGAQRSILRKPCFSFGFHRFFEGRTTENPLEIDRETKLDSTPVSDSILIGFSDDFGVPKRRKNGRKSEFLGLRKPLVFRRLWGALHPGRSRPPSEVSPGSPLSFWFSV